MIMNHVLLHFLLQFYCINFSDENTETHLKIAEIYLFVPTAF